MPVQDRIEALREKHASLERATGARRLAREIRTYAPACILPLTA